MKDIEHDLPYRLEGMPEDRSFGEQDSFSASEVMAFGDYDTFLDQNDLYLGDGKNVYRVRKRLLDEQDAVLTSECIGVCNTDEYELIMDNEDGFGTVLGYVESDFAWYTEEDRFIPSPAQPDNQEPGIENRSNSGDKAVNRVLED